MIGLFCRQCVKWRVSCKGVYRAPDWDGRDGGCSACMTKEDLQTKVQTTLEAFR